jgi:hypothetical protein
MADYELPEDDEDSVFDEIDRLEAEDESDESAPEPKQSGASLDELIAAAMAEPSYTSPGVPGHRAQVELVTKLFERRAEGRDNRSETERACADAMAAKAEKQSADYDAAMADRDWLLENGFDSTSEPPDVVPEYLSQAWKMQRLHTENDYANLGASMSDSVVVAEREKSLPQGHINALREFLHVEGIDPALKDRVDEIIAGFIGLLHDAHALKKGKR